MLQNKLTFESENLVVDYISFKFQDLKDWKEKELASYLLKLGFNFRMVTQRYIKVTLPQLILNVKC